VDIARAAQKHYEAIKNNAAASAAVRRELSSLSARILTDPNASSRITSSTVNGQTFSAQPTMTEMQRFDLLDEVVKRLDRGGNISRMQITTF
jgi:hypothetical protein